MYTVPRVPQYLSPVRIWTPHTSFSLDSGILNKISVPQIQCLWRYVWKWYYLCITCSYKQCYGSLLISNFQCGYEYGSVDLMFKNWKILQVKKITFFSQIARFLWTFQKEVQASKLIIISFLLWAIFFHLDLNRSGSTTLLSTYQNYYGNGLWLFVANCSKFRWKRF